MGTRKRTCLCKATTSNRMGRLTFLGLCSSARLLFALSAFAYVMHGRLRAPRTLIRCYIRPRNAVVLVLSEAHDHLYDDDATTAEEDAVHTTDWMSYKD